MFQEVMRKSIKICDIPYEMIMSVDIDNVEPSFAEAKCAFAPELVNSFSAESPIKYYSIKYNRLRVSETEIANKFYEWMKRDAVKAREDNLRQKHLIDGIKEKLTSWEPK